MNYRIGKATLFTLGGGPLLITIGLLTAGRVHGLMSKSKSAQTPSSQRTSNQHNWNARKQKFSLADGKLHLLLEDLAPTTDYIIGVQIIDNQDTNLLVGEVSYAESGPIRPIAQIVDWPQERIELKPGLIKLTRLSETNGSIVVFARVPSGTEISVQGKGGIITRATPAHGLIVRNGTTEDHEVSGMRTLLSRLILANPGASAR